MCRYLAVEFLFCSWFERRLEVHQLQMPRHNHNMNSQQIGSRVSHQHYGPATVLYMGPTVQVIIWSLYIFYAILVTCMKTARLTRSRSQVSTEYPFHACNVSKDDIPNADRRMWYGIRLDKPTGDSDGSMTHPTSKKTVKYFQTKPRHATFCTRWVDVHTAERSF